MQPGGESTECVVLAPDILVDGGSGHPGGGGDVLDGRPSDAVPGEAQVCCVEYLTQPVSGQATCSAFTISAARAAEEAGFCPV